MIRNIDYVQVSTIQGSRKTASKGMIPMIVDNISIGFQKMHLLKSYLVWLPDMKKNFLLFGPRYSGKKWSIMVKGKIQKVI